MGNFTSQKVYQQITQKQNAQKKGVASAGGELGSDKPMTLAEHDKAVHGGHYNGGRCKFRQQLAAMGKLPPNSGSGNGNDGTSSQPTGTSSGNSTKPTNENPSADTGKSDGGQKSPVVQEDGELKRKFGQVSTTSQEAMNNVNEIQRLYSRAKTSGVKEKLSQIYQNIKKVLGGISDSASNIDSSFSPTSHDDVDKWEEGAISKLDEQELPIDEFKKKVAEIQDIANKHHSRISEEEDWQDELANVYPSDSKELEEWSDKKSDEFFESFKNGKIDNDTYNRRLKEINEKYSEHEERLSKERSEETSEENVESEEETSSNPNNNEESQEDKRRLEVQMRLAGEGNESSPQPKEMSEGRKSLRESLNQHLGSKIDDGSATEKDEEHLDFLEAHRNADEALSKGKITAEEHAKRKKEINDDFARRQYASKFGVEYKPYEPKQKTSGNSDASSSVNNNTPSLSEQRDSLQKSLKTMQFLFGKKSILGNYLTGKYENQIGELNKKIKDVESGKKQISEEAKKVISNPDGKKNSGLRTIHGEVKHGGNSEIQKLIEQMEDEYANAKNSGEKMRIMNRYEMLKKKYEPQTSTQSKKDDSPIVKKDAVEDAISNMSENESYNKYQELLFKSAQGEESLSDDEKRMRDMLYKKYGIGESKK